MQVEQTQFRKSDQSQIAITQGTHFDLVLAFGNSSTIADPIWYSRLQTNYPQAEILMCSTAGEIMDTHIYEDSLCVTAMRFEKAKIRAVSVQISEATTSAAAGDALARSIDCSGLKGILVISDGHSVACEDLLAAMKDVLPPGTLIVGGLAGGKIGFEHTLVGLNEVPAEGKVAAICFYGPGISICYGSSGGWTPFGPERVITASKKNILYELDGQPALDTYKMYLGEYAAELPASALFFPLSVKNRETSISQTRTILSVDETTKSLAFAGNILPGGQARLMTSTPGRLVKGAEQAALQSMNGNTTPPSFALLVSCVGRKLALNQYTEDELEAVRNVYGEGTFLAGFYSYGEISPSYNREGYELHNQTMTIMTITESDSL